MMVVLKCTEPSYYATHAKITSCHFLAYGRASYTRV